MTYQYEKPTADDGDEIPGPISLGLEVFLTNRQLYEESREIFYSKNTFRCTDPYRIPIAYHFLHDLPATSRSLIRSLEIGLREDYYGALHGDEHLPADDEEGTSPREGFWLRMAYNHWNPLCKLLASDMKLRHLGLWLESSYSTKTVWEEAGTVAACYREEEAHPVPQPWWIDPLFKIKNLDSITLAFSTWTPTLHRLAVLARSMYLNMIARMPQMVEIETRADDATQFPNQLDLKLRLHQFPDLDYPFGGDFSIVYRIETREFMWNQVKFRNEGLRLVEVGGEGGKMVDGGEKDEVLPDGSPWTAVCEIKTR